MAPPTTDCSDPASATGQLCAWVSSLTWVSVPEDLRIRAKYLLLDGIACGLVGAHLPWSEKAAEALFLLEPGEGTASIIGHERRMTALNAAMLNSSFIQGFELDDWHAGAPIHSNSILLPALLATADHEGTSATVGKKHTGKDLLLAYIAGLEVGPRAGLALHGAHMLSMGWHSGAVFGPPASAVAVSKLLDLPPGAIEDAIGISCTQAGGLMSAQFESEVKRMQHGFAARSGLLGAFLARSGYVGIKRVFEREYGGFLKQFSSGNNMEPQYLVDEISKDLGEKWQMKAVCVKPYASMAGTHNTIDCLTELRHKHPDTMSQVGNIEKILIELSKPAFEHGGWKATRPLTATGAQMNNAFCAATYLVDDGVAPAQFSSDKLGRNEVWDLVAKTECVLADGFEKMRSRVSVWFKGSEAPLVSDREAAKGVLPPLTNEEIVQKWLTLTTGVISDERREAIEKLVLGLDECEDISALGQLLIGKTSNVIF